MEDTLANRRKKAEATHQGSSSEEETDNSPLIVMIKSDRSRIKKESEGQALS